MKYGRADAAVSAGQYRRADAMAPSPQDMPMSNGRVAALWPTLRAKSIVLDMGASIGADAAALVEWG